MTNGLVRDVGGPVLFDPDKLLDLPGFGEKKVAQIREGIEKSQRPALPRRLSLPGDARHRPEGDRAPHRGRLPRHRLAARAGGERGPRSRCWKSTASASGPRRRCIRELGRRRMKRQDREAARGGRAARRGEPRTGVSSDLPQTFAGQTWCVTGSFEHLNPREKAMEEVVRAGRQGADPR